MNSSASVSHRPRAPLACLVVVALALAVLARLGPLPESMLAMQLVWGVASVAWMVAVRLARGGKVGVRAVIVGALLLRAIAFSGDPQLSDDVARYVWEGGLVGEGRSPYTHAPADPELSAARQRWPAVYERVNHPEVSAAYPPLAQAAMAAAVGLAGGPERDEGRRAATFLRALYALCDVGVVFALLAALRAWGLDPGLAVVWAWCPLVVQEFAGVGHFDSLGVLLLVAGLAAWKRGFGRLSSALVVAGGLVKLLPLAALPWLLRGPRWMGRAALAAAVAVLGTAWVLLLDGGEAAPGAGLGTGIGQYGLRWEAGSLVYRFVEELAPSGWRRDESWTDPRIVGRVLVVLALGLLALREWARRSDPQRATGALLRGFLILTPTLHPWYVCWSVPFLAFSRSGAWTLLVALAPLLYWPLANWRTAGVWEEPGWLWPCTALPFFALLMFEWLSARRGARRRGRAPADADQAPGAQDDSAA